MEQHLGASAAASNAVTSSQSDCDKISALLQKRDAVKADSSIPSPERKRKLGALNTAYYTVKDHDSHLLSIRKDGERASSAN